MLPKSQRLAAPDIRKTLRAGIRIHSNWCSFAYIPQSEQPKNQEENSGKSLSRFAVVVPASVDKRATVRNRIRRCIHEGIRLNSISIPLSPSGVFLAKRASCTMKQDQYYAEIRQIFSQALSNRSRNNSSGRLS